MSRLAGAILSGGRSSRMGGGDKALLEIHGKSLLSLAIDRFRPQVDDLALNANGDPTRFAAFGLPVIGDTITGYAGPLAGVLSAMMWAAERGDDRIVTVAGDSPFFPRDLVARLIQAEAAKAGQQIVVASSAGRRHPVFALWPVELAARLEDHLAGPGAGRVNDFLVEQGFADVEFGMTKRGMDPFFNINTPHDLEEARNLATEDLE